MPGADNFQKTKVSIVIPAYNEEKYISDCLLSLANQKTGHWFEVILVDNCSSDKTAAMAEKYRQFLNLKIISEKIKGRGRARAVGFASAAGEIILSTDADCILPENWIEQMVSALQKSGCQAAAGSFSIKDQTAVKNFLVSNAWFLIKTAFSVVFGYCFLFGSNFAIKKESYLKSGGFNKSLDVYEDIDLSFRVKKTGKIAVVNSTIITSGRRYRDSLIKGVFAYLKAIFCCLINRKKSAVIEDIR